MRRTYKSKARKGVPPLVVHREDGPPAAANRYPEDQRHAEQGNDVEEFWAGRNHAMRQSARIAA